MALILTASVKGRDDDRNIVISDPERWFSEEILPHAKALEKYAIRLLRGRVADAEDLTQDTLLRAYEKRHTYRYEGAADAWLRAILRNSYINSAKNDRKLPVVSLMSIVSDHNDFWHPASIHFSSVEEIYFRRESAAAIWEGIEKLPQPYRIILKLAADENISYQEIADRLNLPLGTVRSRLSRARARLSRSLAMGNTRGCK